MSIDNICPRKNFFFEICAGDLNNPDIDTLKNLHFESKCNNNSILISKEPYKVSQEPYAMKKLLIKAYSYYYYSQGGITAKTII